MGYHLAGFEDITGVDHEPQPRYPFKFVQADAMDFDLTGFDLVHASPPCQLFSRATRDKSRHPDCLEPTRQRLIAKGGHWVIENVERAPMQHCFVLCGVMFGLQVFRHRKFETSHLILQPYHPRHRGRRIGNGYFSVAGKAGRWKSYGVVKRDCHKGTVEQWRRAMGISWMTRAELSQAIPPAYTEYIGKRYMEYLNN